MSVIWVGPKLPLGQHRPLWGRSQNSGRMVTGFLVLLTLEFPVREETLTSQQRADAVLPPSHKSRDISATDTELIRQVWTGHLSTLSQGVCLLETTQVQGRRIYQTRI